MAVHLTRIYTKTGDDGTTALGDFSRVRKTDVRLAAYADTDECNAAIGVAVTVGGLAEEVLAPLRQVQNDLFDVGADLCNPIVDGPEVPAAAGDRGLRHAARGLVRRVQRGPAEARLVHPARRHPRRGATCTWRARSPAAPSGRCGRCWTTDAERTNPLTAQYLNRLSDLLFILGRVANPDGDVLWRPGRPARRASQDAWR